MKCNWKYHFFFFLTNLILFQPKEVKKIILIYYFLRLLFKYLLIDLRPQLLKNDQLLKYFFLCCTIFYNNLMNSKVCMFFDKTETNWTKCLQHRLKIHLWFLFQFTVIYCSFLMLQYNFLDFHKRFQYFTKWWQHLMKNSL